MGYLIPKQELTVEEIMEIETATVEKLLEIAAKQTGIAKEELVVREIMPKTDLGLTNEEWKISYTAAYTEERKVNITLPKNKFIAFFGATNLSAVPKTLYVGFATPAKRVDNWHFSKIYSYNNPVGYAKEPVIFVGGKTMHLWFYGNATGDDLPELKGIVVEPLGELVSPAAGKE